MTAFMSLPCCSVHAETICMTTEPAAVSTKILKLCSAGPAFDSFSEAAFQRCERIIAQHMGTARPHTNGSVAHTPDPDKDFVIGALDLISGLAEGLGPGVQPLVARSQLRTSLLQCCQVRCVLDQGHLCLSAGCCPA